MAALSPSTKTTVGLPALHALTVVSSGTGSIVRLSNLPGGEPYAPIDLTDGITKVIGPFGIPTTHRLECLTGAIDYSVSASDFPSVTSDVERIVKLTQADYDALSPVDDATLYLIDG